MQISAITSLFADAAAAINPILLWRSLTLAGNSQWLHSSFSKWLTYLFFMVDTVHSLSTVCYLYGNLIRYMVAMAMWPCRGMQQGAVCQTAWKILAGSSPLYVYTWNSLQWTCLWQLLISLWLSLTSVSPVVCSTLPSWPFLFVVVNYEYCPFF